MQTTEQMSLKTITRYPLTGTAVCSERGKSATAIAYAARYEWQASAKAGSPLPVFVRGQFLVKPYSVSSHKFVSDLVTLKKQYCRSDGVRFDYEWVGKVAGLSGIYNACPKNIAKPTSMLAGAVNAAYAKVSSGALDSLTELGEIRETLSMLRSPLKEMRKFLSKKGPGAFATLGDATRYFARNHRKFRREVGEAGTAAASTWLEWRYGIRPLLMTIQEILGLASTQLQRAGNQIRSKRKRETVTTVRTVNPVIRGIKTSLILEETVRVEAIVFYRRNSDQTMSDLLGFSYHQLPETVWDLTRLSFIVDWFLGIGDWIRAITPSNTVTVLGATQSWKYTCKGEVIIQYETPQGGLWTEPSNCGHFLAETFDREVLSGPTNPLFQGVTNLDLSKILDMVALTYTGLTRRK